MQILSIHLNNIKSHRDTELIFSPGINVLSGANGAGKSTVFEAIGYALFGVDAQDFVSNVARFISIGAKSGRIDVIFQSDDGDIWKVTRTVGNSSKWLLARKRGKNFEVEEHARIEETAARITGLLGLSRSRPLSEQFRLVIGPFQNEFLGPFIIRQAAKRQEAFDEILGIDTWRRTFKATATLSKDVQAKIKLVKAEADMLEQQLIMLPVKESECADVRKDLSDRQYELTDKELHFKTLQATLVELDSKKIAIDNLSRDIEKLQSRITDGAEKIASQKLLVEAAEKADSIVIATRLEKEAFEKAEQKLSELREKEKIRRRLDQEIAGLEKTAQRLSQNLAHEQADILKVDKDLHDEETRFRATRTELLEKCNPVNNNTSLQELRLESERLKAERSGLAGRSDALAEGQHKLSEGTCPFFQEQCRNIAGTKPQDHFSIKRGDLERLIAQLDGRIGDVDRKVKASEDAEREWHADKVRIQELDKLIITLEGRRQTNIRRNETLELLKREESDAVALVMNRKAEIMLYASLDEEVSKAEADKKSFQASRDAYSANLLVADDLGNRRQTLVNWSNILESLKRDLVEINSRRQCCLENYQQSLHEEVRKERDAALSDVARRRQQIVEMGRTIERLEKEIEELKRIRKAVAEKQKTILSLEEKERLVKFLRNQVFKNVSAELSERFREEISLRADRIYRSIADSDEELCWGDNYQIILRDMADGTVRERTDDQLSGGQTMSAVVALRLALLQTVGARLAFFDEPTSNLDASRRENLANAFRSIDVGREEVAEHWYDQLFLISHDVTFTEITDQMIQIGE